MKNTNSPQQNSLNNRVINLKDQLLKATTLSIIVVSIPGILASFYQMQMDGIKAIPIIHWFIYLFLLVIAIFSRFLPYNFRLFSLVISWMIVGLTSFFSWELIAFALSVMVCLSVFSTLFINNRFGFFCIGITLLTIVFIKIGVSFQWIVCPTHLKPYINSIPTWINAIVCVVLLGSILIFSLGKIQKEYFSAIQELDKHNHDLLISKKRLEESELQYNKLFENMIDAFAIHEPIFDENNKPIDYRFLMVNPAFEAMTGLKSDKIIGKTVLEILPDSDEYWVEEYGKVALTGEATRFENYLKKLDSFFEIRLYSPTPNQIAGIFQDITRRKKAETEQQELENQLRQSHKMEAVGTLAGGVAHDFNNLLMPVMGYTEMLIEDYPDNEDIQSNLKEILKAATRAKSLAEQILTFSRRKNMQFEPINVSSVLLETISLLRASIPKNIDIVENIQNKESMIMGDSVQLQQIIMNLCTNSFHAIEKDNGQISISLHEEIIDEFNSWNGEQLPAGDYLLLSIEDNGHGIDPETQERIFDPYFTTKEKGKGTGLGLSVVMGIVNRLKGGIRLTSNPDEGTRFDIYLPIVQDTYTSKNNNNNAVETGVEKILLIDDEESILDIEKKLLTRLGYHVTAFKNSLDAVKTFEKTPEAFDLVITDLTMPGLPGDKLAEKLISIRPDIPVILCSGYSQEQSSIMSETNGIKAMLTKPILKKELARAIRKVIDKKINI